ncbi:SDR family NAD(P)-dependent oxidoreductase [Amaricoccus solimangrovi]|uniref:SDR family oxidoreductase n=1 Tax=Amaricoccus solimangrovi TaxID=2589815 RepID=A0A501WKY4_9RHOB|nr:SDR family oxidoreductase [Amaricoccus solimangrovi]TPE47711.1 SDR family oxidoreductase [Amaricoccus solimangrovi]
MTEAPFDGQVALVSGGARGIGRAIARRLARGGARVVLTGLHDMEGARAAAAELSREGARVSAIAMDLGDRASVDAAVAGTLDRAGRLDIAVNNAGGSRPGRLLDLPAADWDALFDLHARGFFYFATAAARAMGQAPAPGEGGAIIGIAGASALRCYPGAGAYGAAKAAVVAAARQMAVEWAPLGLRVNCVCPGPIRSAGSDWETREPALAAEVTGIPIARAGTPEEVAEAVAYLAGARYVTGQRIVVDGGSTTTWYIKG